MNGTDNMTVYAYKNYGFITLNKNVVGIIYVGTPKRGSSATLPRELAKRIGRRYITNYVIPLPQPLYETWDALYRDGKSIVAGVVLTYDDADVINTVTDYMSMVSRVLTNKGKIKQIITDAVIRLLGNDATPLFTLKTENPGLPYSNGPLRFTDIAKILRRRYGTQVITES